MIQASKRHKATSQFTAPGSFKAVLIFKTLSLKQKYNFSIIHSFTNSFVKDPDAQRESDLYIPRIRHLLLLNFTWRDNRLRKICKRLWDIYFVPQELRELSFKKTWTWTMESFSLGKMPVEKLLD